MILARTRKPPRGLTVVAVLLFLVLLTLIGGALLKVGQARRELGRAQERRLQAEWLAESGLQRASAALEHDPKYSGETWNLDSGDLGIGEPTKPSHGDADADVKTDAQAAAAVVTIAVESVAADPNHRRIRVQSEYPREPSRRARHTKQLMIELDPSKAGARS